ncbi:MAG: hypothetical protein JRE70_20380 [Deltaproteobacteria bacterium]|nr:hypothetical protein [Deltaproteobacteria bacterium]
MEAGRSKAVAAFDNEPDFDAECPRCSAKLVMKIAQHVEVLVQQPALKRIRGETFFDPSIKSEVELTQDLKDTSSALLAQLSKLVRLLDAEQVLPSQHRH